MTKNNPFTVEITIEYDYNLSSINFQEEMKQMKFEREGLWQYTSNGEIELIDRLEDLFTIKNDNRKFLIKWLEWTENEAENYSKDELRQEIIDQLNFEDLYDENNQYLDGLIIKRKFHTIITKGYSQGDYAKVIIPTKQLRELWGTPDTTKDEDLVSKEYIGNLFWDSPLWGRIEIMPEFGSDTTIELYEIEDIPQYLNYPQNIDFINEKIMEYVKEQFKFVPALQNILDAVKEALPSEIKHPCSCSC